MAAATIEFRNSIASIFRKKLVSAVSIEYIKLNKRVPSASSAQFSRFGSDQTWSVRECDQDCRARGITSLAPGVKILRLRSNLRDRVRLGIVGILWPVAYEVLPADHDHFKSLATSCMMERCHHIPHKGSQVPHFRCWFDSLPFRISTRLFTIRFH